MKFIFLALMLLGARVSFAGTCYARSNCKGHVVYRWGKEGTTANQCYDEGGASLYIDSDKRCLNISAVTTPPPSEEGSGRACVTHTCTSQICECCTGPNKHYGELCE